MNKFSIIPDQQTPKVERIAPSEIIPFLKENKLVLDDFLSFAESQKTAVGLAANQTALNNDRWMQNLFAIMDLKTRKWRLILNPKIEKHIGMFDMKEEGCLTWFRRKIVAERSRAVEVSYVDINGTLHTGEIYKGFEAQIWQHEINHLNGVEENVVDAYFNTGIKKRDVGRNEKCPCGSELKYKNCCLNLIK